jgi:hypothetical protein
MAIGQISLLSLVYKEPKYEYQVHCSPQDSPVKDPTIWELTREGAGLRLSVEDEIA